jgi:hypothetical protein
VNTTDLSKASCRRALHDISPPLEKGPLPISAKLDTVYLANAFYSTLSCITLCTSRAPDNEKCKTTFITNKGQNPDSNNLMLTPNPTFCNFTSVIKQKFPIHIP